MANLAEARKGQIARVLLKEVVRQQGIEIPSRKCVKKRLKKLAMKTGFSDEELKQFTMEFYQELLSEVFK